MRLKLKFEPRLLKLDIYVSEAQVENQVSLSSSKLVHKVMLGPILDFDLQVNILFDERLTFIFTRMKQVPSRTQSPSWFG